MNRIIRITFVAIAILSTVRAKCKQPVPMFLDRVCGSDGKTYFNKYWLEKNIECLKEKNNVTSVDLHLVHHWSCFIWEKYGIGTTSFILITLGLIIFGVCWCKFYPAIRNIWRKEELFF